MTNEKTYPLPFLFGALGVAAIRLQYASQFVSDLEGRDAVLLGLILLTFTSYSIMADWILVRKTKLEMKNINRLLGGYLCSLLVIFFMPQSGSVGGLLFLAGVGSSAILGYFFYKEKRKMLDYKNQ
jgi:hypothetical protein